MISANELRIGNLVTNAVNPPEVVLIVRQITNDGNDEGGILAYIQGKTFNYSLADSMINPIPLTEEWLIKFGFEYSEHYLNWQKIKPLDRRLGFHFGESGRIIFMRESDNYHGISIEVEYVHQFQNLVFSLTGEELTIKEKV